MDWIILTSINLGSLYKMIDLIRDIKGMTIKLKWINDAKLLGPKNLLEIAKNTIKLKNIIKK